MPVRHERELSLKRFLNFHRFAGDVTEERALACRLELFGPERERLDREGQFEVLGDVEDLLDAISSRSLEVGNDQEVDLAERVHVSSRYASLRHARSTAPTATGAGTL